MECQMSSCHCQYGHFLSIPISGWTKKKEMQTEYKKTSEGDILFF